MIKKEIKEYKRGNSFNYRINIAKQDNLPSEVYILTPEEYIETKKELEELKEELNNKDKIIKKLNDELEKYELEKLLYDVIEEKQRETLKALDDQQIKNIEKITNNFTSDVEKYVTIIQLQTQALKQIKNMSKWDIVTNKHKNLIKESIKEIKDKPSYEMKKIETK